MNNERKGGIGKLPMNGTGNELSVISRMVSKMKQDLSLLKDYLTMIKLSASRKKFILEIFAVLVVCAFLATPLVPSIGLSGTGANTKPIYGVHSTPFVSSNNNSSNAGYVKYTLVLSNNTLINGNFINSGNENGINPVGVTFDSSNGYVYVANDRSNSVSVINGTTNTVIDTIGVGSGPYAVAFDSSNGYVYVTNKGSNSVSVINGATNKVIDTIAVGYYPIGVAFDSSNGYLYVADSGTYVVSVINGATNTVIDTIGVGTYPGAISVDSSNGYVYVANYGYGTISIIATTTKTAEYPVTFTQSGLPYGTEWYVNLSNSMDSGAITGSSYSFSLPNGTYSYSIGAVSGYSASPSFGSVNVSGSNVPVAITFTPVKTIVSKYTITFSETGLPSGTSWSVTLNGISESSTTNTITFTMPNGTYSYAIGSISGYSVSTSSGSITVNGSDMSQTITFTPVKITVIKYTVTFTETGLPSGTTWYVNLTNGQTFSSTTGKISFSEPNGTYSYTVSSVSGYSVSSSSGSISVNGASVSKTVSFTPINKSTPPSGISSTELYGIIGVVAAIAVIGSVLAIMRKKR